MVELSSEIDKRRTFAIISHPDAGKTTLTEKLLLFGGAIQLAGSVKGRKAERHATSDWMELEKQRGISVTSSVMQFFYNDIVVNLLDTPGHEDFSEDTYRTLTAVDSALMVIDVAKGVEDRTIKLMEVCRLRNTPIITFINKLDREGRDPIELMDEVEKVLNIKCAPITWPIGMGKRLKGVIDLRDETIHLFDSTNNSQKNSESKIQGLNNPLLDQFVGDIANELREEIQIVKGASHNFEQEQFKNGELTPVFFGSAINNFGVKALLDAFSDYAPRPMSRNAEKREVEPCEKNFSGFIFKIQANMDPAHRDRVAFMRVCSGSYKKGMKMHHVRTGKQTRISDAITFQADTRKSINDAFPGDIIGLHNHGTIQIGDTFTEGETLKYSGVPYFAPELFQRVVLKDPLKLKQLQKGVVQLSEEGATQVFRPFKNNDILLGAVGILQFEVAIHRLGSEYGVDALIEPTSIKFARWVECEDKKILKDFTEKVFSNLAEDGDKKLVYLAPSKVNLSLTRERWPEVRFLKTRDL
tara:strand:+ start:53705 stop:55285 length:1581 start_codon:yes stop_codon:yes gene_type:complete